MIVYDPQHQFSLLEFGIQIPVMNSRASRTFANLSSHPLLGPRADDWHLHRDGDHLAAKDLERVHDAAYVQKLFSEQLEEEIVNTFELVDGRFRQLEVRAVALEEAVASSLDVQRAGRDGVELEAGSRQCLG